MNKNLLLALLVSIQSCHKLREKEIFLNPPNVKTYSFDSNTDGSGKFKSLLTLQFDKGDNGIKVTTTMTKHAYGDPLTDKEFNSELQKDVNVPEVNLYNKYGKPLSIEGDKNPLGRMLIIEFPNRKLKKGETWSGRKSAEPGIPFKTILTKYKVESLSENMNKIDVEMIFELDENVHDLMKDHETYYMGYYIVNDDGTVRVANLTTYESTKFSNQTGKIEIKEQK